MIPTRWGADEARWLAAGVGLWLDADGHIRVSVAKALWFFGWPDTPENRARVIEFVRATVAQDRPDVPVIELEN